MRRISKQLSLYFLLGCSLIFLCSPSEAGIRGTRKFGLGLEGYQGSFGVIQLAWNINDSFRLQAGIGIGGNSLRAYKGGLKYLFLDSNFSPYLGAEFWSITGSPSGINLSANAPALIAGLDYTFDMGFNLGGGIAAYSSGIAIGMFYIAYYF